MGQVHFIFKGDNQKLNDFFSNKLKQKLIKSTDEITQSMRERGGGILAVELRDMRSEMEDYYQIYVTFDTVDSMGANFINSCLEQFAETLRLEIAVCPDFTDDEKDSLDLIMSILSNYTPNCIVRAEVSSPVESLQFNGMKGEKFAQKFAQAIRIAQIDPHRAVTHNKGIMNGVDSVVMATGNDFRAVEACAHSYASRGGTYASLTHCQVKDGILSFWIDLPISVGVVGGLTNLHPLVKVAFDILGKPSAKKLMSICAAVGLLQNFAAVGALVTTGIQKGHMKMHLLNILAQLGVKEDSDKQYFSEYFSDKKITFKQVKEVVKEYFNK